MFDDEVPGVHRFFFFFLMIRRPPRSTLFPYTTALPIYADVLVHESTYGKGDERMARNHGHSTNMQAAQIARDAGAKRLLLNHVSARFLGRDCRQMEKDAATIFENVKVVRDLEEVII